MKLKKLLLWPLRFVFGPTGNWSLAFGIGLGMIAGLTPMLALHNVVIVFLLLVFRVNVAFAILSFLVFSVLKLALAPVFHQSGLALLTAPGLQDLWTALYNIHILRLSRFNNTQVLGSLVWSLGLFPPIVVISYVLLRQFHKTLSRVATAMPWLRAETKEN